LLQIDTSFASWRDCVSIAWVSGATGSGISRILKRVTELIPLWSTVPTTLELNAWRHKMAVGLAGMPSACHCTALTIYDTAAQRSGYRTAVQVIWYTLCMHASPWYKRLLSRALACRMWNTGSDIVEISEGRSNKTTNNHGRVPRSGRGQEIPGCCCSSD
jgi:hypothetical protein